MKGDRHAVVPRADVRSYYDLPVIKQPAWTWEVPWYFFTGGLSGAAAVLAVAGEVTGRPRLARAARRVAAASALPAPALLISDLGRPERFHHMLRVFKVTSPLSVGSWVLVAFVPAAAGSALLREVGRLPRLARWAGWGAAALAPPMTTYTAVLLSDTAVPVWHEARRELPFVFVGSAAASAGAAVSMLVGDADGLPARRLAVAGAALELAVSEVMEQRLGGLAAPYQRDRAGRFARAAKGLTVLGMVATAAGGRRRRLGMMGAAALLAGSVCQRWAVFRAGFQSAGDPAATVGPQRRRLEEQTAVTAGG